MTKTVYYSSLSEEYRNMLTKLQALSTKSLLAIWDSLTTYNPKDEYDKGIDMDTWCYEVHKELNNRNVPHKF